MELLLSLLSRTVSPPQFTKFCSGYSLKAGSHSPPQFRCHILCCRTNNICASATKTGLPIEAPFGAKYIIRRYGGLCLKSQHLPAISRNIQQYKVMLKTPILAGAVTTEERCILRL